MWQRLLQNKATGDGSFPALLPLGPGAANMVTACATATVNNIPLLVFPADSFASRQPDPVPSAAGTEQQSGNNHKRCF